MLVETLTFTCPEMREVEMTNDKKLFLCVLQRNTKKLFLICRHLEQNINCQHLPELLNEALVLFLTSNLLWRAASVKCASPNNNSICFTTPFRLTKLQKNNLVKVSGKVAVWVAEVTQVTISFFADDSSSFVFVMIAVGWLADLKDSPQLSTLVPLLSLMMS